MKKLIVLPALLCLLWAGCKPAHPARIAMDPSFEPNKVNAVLVTPTISSIGEGEDPKRESESIVNASLLELLEQRTDYKFVSPEQFKMAVAKGKLGTDWAAFKESWASRHQMNKEFFQKLHLELATDAVLVPLVTLWNKDEADYREASTSSVTQVGITLTLIDPTTGTILWEGADQNYKEAVRSEDRTTVQQAGLDRRIQGKTELGRDMYAAPPYEDVASLVLKALVDALPRRGSAQ
jgi:PBP1b-binding outer membrane lipoprotein LpoB